MISRMIWNCHFLKLNYKSNTLYLYRNGRLHKSLLKQLLCCMLMKQKIRTKLDKVLGVVKISLLQYTPRVFPNFPRYSAGSDLEGD